MRWGVSIDPSTANMPCAPQRAPADLAADDSITGPIRAIAVSAIAIAAIPTVAVAPISTIAVAPNAVATRNAIAVATCNAAVTDVCRYAVRLRKRRRRHGLRGGRNG
jgi:hypothetical protein